LPCRMPRLSWGIAMGDCKVIRHEFAVGIKPGLSVLEILDRVVKND
jgi:hypothetical protein